MEDEEDVSWCWKHFLGVDAICCPMTTGFSLSSSGIIRCQNKEKLVLRSHRPAKHRYSVIEKFSEAVRLFWKWDGNFRAFYEVRSHKTKSHSWLCFSCLTFDGYQLNAIEITGFFLHTRGDLAGASFTPTWNWINKFDYRYVTKFLFQHTETSLHPPPRGRHENFFRIRSAS